MGSCSLLQGIFLTQGSNPGLPHCRQLLYQPSHQGQTTGVGSCSLLQGIFPTQESNLDLLHCRQILYHLSQSQQEAGFPGGSVGKESACNVGNLGSIPELGRSPGKGNSYPLQYSGLENVMDRGVWLAIVHGVAKNGTQLSHTHIHTHIP